VTVGWQLPTSPLNLTKVISRMTNCDAGVFDLDITGGHAIECRSGRANNAYTVVFSFSNNITGCGTANIGTVSAGPNANQCSVAINVPTGNYVTVQLSGVTDFNTTMGTFSNTMGVLVGD